MKKNPGKKSIHETIAISEIRYRRLFESAKDGILILDTKTGKVLDVNPFLINLLGYSREKFLDKAIWEIGFFKDVAANRENFEELKRKKYIRFEDLPLETARGQSVAVEFVSNVYKEDHHDVIQCNIRDITERKRAADSIAAEREKLRVTLRSIGDGVITTDANGNIDVLNVVAEELCGWTNDEAKGKPLTSVFNIVNETTRRPHENPVEKVLKTGTVVELENHSVIISRTGVERIIADSAAPIRAKTGAIIGVVLVFRDITEKQKLLEAMQRNQKLESLGVLAAGIAHDFNNLMCGIFGYIELAVSETNQENVRTRLSKSMDTIDRARGLTRQLLTFSSGGAPARQITGLTGIVEKTAKFALSGSRSILKCSLPQDIWSCDIDKNQIAQVIENLVINARQSMAGGGTVEISAENIFLKNNQHPVLDSGKYVKVIIKDSGIGMTNATISRIFDPFFTTKNMGHGLGLAICHSIINRHNGAIDVSSVIDKGSAFTIFLPAFPEEATSEPVARKVHKGSGTIIVMDDEEVMREILSDMLQFFGYTVKCENEGGLALELFKNEIAREQPIKALILDLTVPGGLGGKDIIKEIRKTHPKTAVFVASGYADDPIVQNPTTYGFTASICKPFGKDELEEMLNNNLE